MTAEAGLLRRINPDRVLTPSERTKRSRDKHRERINEKQREVRQTERGRYYRNKGHWVANGIVEPEEGWERFYYDTFLSAKKCSICDIQLGDNGQNQDGKCLDHDGLSGHIRGIVCRRCNSGCLKNWDIIRPKLMLDIHRFARLNEAIAPDVVL